MSFPRAGRMVMDQAIVQDDTDSDVVMDIDRVFEL